MVETREENLEDLEKFWSCLSQRINRGDVEWLTEKRSGLFPEEPNFPKNHTEALRMLVAPNALWRSLSDSKKQNLSFTIRDVLDAKRKEDKMGYDGTNDLPREYWVQMAGILKLEVPENAPLTEVATLVLREM